MLILRNAVDEQHKSETHEIKEGAYMSSNRLGIDIQGSVVDSLGSPTAPADYPSEPPPASGAISPWSELSDAESDLGVKDFKIEAVPNLYSEQKFYVETYLGLLTTISMSIRKAGAKIRYAKADKYLEEHPPVPEYNVLREHLRFILTVPLAQQRLSNGMPVLTADGGALSVDYSDLTPVQHRLIEDNIIRRNRIAYAQRQSKVSFQSAVVSTPQPPATEIAKRDLFNLDRQAVSTHESACPGSTVRTAQIVNETRSIAIKSNLSATEMGSDFAITLPQERRAKSTFTRITNTGAKLDYPRPPPGKGNFQCPYCVQVLSTDYRSDSRWRFVVSPLGPRVRILTGLGDTSLKT